MATNVADGSRGEVLSAAELAARLDAARAIVHRSVVWSMGVSLVPVPLADVVAIGAVQIEMIKKLGDRYGVPFREHRAKNIVSSLVGSLGSLGFGSMFVFSVTKLLPVAGQVAGVVGLPVVAGAITHAMGGLFIQHFEAGGTLLDFDPVALRDHFRREFEAAKHTVRAQHAEKT